MFCIRIFGTDPLFKNFCYAYGVGYNINHNNTITLVYPTVLKYHAVKEMHSRDITVLLWFNTVPYSSLFEYFIAIYTMVPTLVENSL